MFALILHSAASLAIAISLASCTLIPRENPGGKRTATIAEDTVIVSGEQNYWRRVPARSTNSAATVTVDTRQKLQTWYGLGGTFNEMGWQALKHLPARERTEVMKLLFDGEAGIGLTWGRIPMGASDYALERYTLADVAGDTTLEHFSIARDQRYLIPFIKAAQAIKPDLKLWASPWTPPPWMKTNHAYDRGAFDPRYHAVYADYFVAWINAYERHGMPIDHVQPQNEPGWSQAYPSCGWGPSTADGVLTERPVTLGTFVEDHLIPAIGKAGLDTDVWYGTLSNNDTFAAYWSALSERGRAGITGVGLQWGTFSRAAELAATRGKDGKPLLVMQTEHRCGNYPWLAARATSAEDADRTNFLPTHAPNNHAYAEESWDLIKQWVEAGVHIYSAWNMVLDTGGFNMDTTRPWPQNALIAVDMDAGQYRATPAYYVFRHIGQYVEAGAVRVAVQGGDGLAFENPDGSVVTIVHNRAAVASETVVSVRDKKLQVELPARGWATLVLK